MTSGAALVQVCPAGSGGVRDYAQCLHEAWTQRGVASSVIEAAPPVAGTPGLHARLEALARPCAGRLEVVLHFSGYGYARRGLCLWLVDELRAFKARHGERARLTVVFHELFAIGVPWRSAFWLAPIQSLIARRLAGLADRLWTNTGHHARWLRAAAGPAKAIDMRPVFSTIGEPPGLPPWPTRHPRLVVFGSASTRARALHALRGREDRLHGLGITELVEVGAGAPQIRDAGPWPTRHAGRLPVSELRELLLASRFGLLDYPARHLGKSSVLAAYAAHGCVAIDTCADGRSADGLAVGTHVLRLGEALPVAADAWAGTAQRLAHWYRDHTLARQADEMLARLTAADNVS